MRGTWRTAMRWLAACVGAIGAALLLTACDPDALQLQVTVADDGADAVPGDGVCEKTLGGEDCSLRAAVMEANATPGFDTITLPPNISTHALGLAGSGEDGAATGDLDITENVTIQTGGALPASITGNGDRIFDVHSGLLFLSTVQVSGGQAADGAGMLVRPGAGTLIVGSTIRGNTASAGAGAVSGEPGSSVTLLLSTVSANSGTDAGGVWARGKLSLQQSTISGNTSGSGVGGIRTTGATVATSSFSTIATNTGPLASAWHGPGKVTGTAIDGTGTVCGAMLASGGSNVSRGTTCLDGSGAGDVIDAQVRLGFLVSAGGSTQTHVPLPGSPVLDAVPVGVAGCGTSITYDQRGTARPQDGSCDIGAVEVQPLATLVVTSTSDAVDATPGDGTCRTSAGVCTLRAAVMEANTWPTPDEIELASGVTYPLTIAGPSEFQARQGDLNIVDDVTVRSTGPALAVVDGGDLDRVFNIASGAEVTFERLRITDGSATTGGGIILQGDLHLLESRVDANAATHPSGGGGGIEVGVSSELIVEASTIDANTSANRGGGININSSGSTTQILRSTLSGNVATAGGALHASGTVTVQDATITANTATNTGGVHVVAGSVTIARSIVADQSGGADCTTITGSIGSGGHNLESATSCGFTAGGDLQGTFPGLDPLGDNDGPTPTHEPLPGSAAIDAGGSGCTSFDQRGVVRPSDGDGSGTAECDTGAVEGGSRVFVVNRLTDLLDANPGDGLCEATAGAGNCSLRGAVLEANAHPGLDTIRLSPGTHELTRSAAHLGLETDLVFDLDLREDVMIEGTGATLPVVDGNDATRIFEVHDGANVTMRRVHLHDANSVGGDGAGILVTNGLLVLEESRIASGRTGPNPSGFHGDGGGITVTGGSVASIIASTFDINMAERGGAIHAEGDGTMVQISRSTLSANTGAEGGGGGLHAEVGGDGQVQVVDTTITSSSRAGIHVTGTVPVDVVGSIVADQAMNLFGVGPFSDCIGLVTSSGSNLESDSTCGFTGPGDVQLSPALLGALGNNGGLTPTRVPQPGSPAIDSAGTSCAGVDQRGVTRPTDGDGNGSILCDKGAVER